MNYITIIASLKKKQYQHFLGEGLKKDGYGYWGGKGPESGSKNDCVINVHCSHLLKF